MAHRWHSIPNSQHSWKRTRTRTRGQLPRAAWRSGSGGRQRAASFPRCTTGSAGCAGFFILLGRAAHGYVPTPYVAVVPSAHGFSSIQYWRFKFLVAQYEEWLEHHARGYRPRRRSENIRDVGEQCAPWKDNVDAPGPDDAYECDDFVMRDDSDAEFESECATPPPEVYDDLGEELAAEVENLKDLSSSDRDDALSAASQTSGSSEGQEVCVCCAWMRRLLTCPSFSRTIPRSLRRTSQSRRR
jgi:hypothetical protein